MSASPARKTPPPAEDDPHGAETRRIPAEVVQAVIRAAEEVRAAASAPAAPERHTPSGTRRRVSADEIAQFLAAKDAPPVVDSYAPEVAAPGPSPSVPSVIVEVEHVEALPEAAAAPPVSAAPALVSVAAATPVPWPLPPRAYLAPRVELLPAPSIMERPLAVFLLAMGAVILVLLPLVYALVAR